MIVFLTSVYQHKPSDMNHVVMRITNVGGTNFQRVHYGSRTTQVEY